MREGIVARVASRLLAAGLIISCAACLLPVLVMALRLVWSDGHLTVAPIAAAFSDPARLGVLMANSACVVGGAVLVALMLGIPCGFLCFRTDLPFRHWIVVGCILGSCVPLYVTVTAWMALLGMETWLYSAGGAAWITGVAHAPLVTLITGVGFATGDRDLEDQARLDTGRWGVFRHATLPAGAWSIVAAALVVTVLSVWDIAVTDILTVRTFAEEVFTQFQLGAGPARAAAIALPLIPLFAACWLVAGRIFRHHGEAAWGSPAEPPHIIPLGRARIPLTLVVLAGTLLCIAIPILALFRTVSNLSHLIAAWDASRNELIETVIVLPVAATLCLALALAAAWAHVRVRRLSMPVAVLILALISVPAPVIGIGLIETLNHPGFSGVIYDSRAGLILAYIIRSLPFAILLLIPAIRAIPREIEEAVALDGGDWLARIRAVVLPMRWRAVLTTWFFVMAFSMAEMGASFLVVPPGHATLSTRFFTLIHYGVYPDAAGLCLLFLAIVGLTGSMVALLSWPFLKSRLL